MSNRHMCSVLFLLVALGLFNASSAQAQRFQQFKTLAGAPENAKASLFLLQQNGRTMIFIDVKDAAPDTLYTVWLRLAARSPLTGKTVAPMANPEDIGDLAAVTPASDLTLEANALGLFGEDPKVGSDDLANGFCTDRRGFGLFFARLDYPVVKGAFQFSEFDENLAPVALDIAPAFTIRLAAHPDGTGHGLVPDVHVPSFDWSWE